MPAGRAAPPYLHQYTPITMVVILLKNGEHDTFLYETTCSTSNDSWIRELVSSFLFGMTVGGGGEVKARRIQLSEVNERAIRGKFRMITTVT